MVTHSSSPLWQNTQPLSSDSFTVREVSVRPHSGHSWRSPFIGGPLMLSPSVAALGQIQNTVGSSTIAQQPQAAAEYRCCCTEGNCSPDASW